MIEFLSILDKYSGVITNLSVIFGGLWALLNFWIYLKEKRFNNYHRLIKELVDGDTPGSVLRLDRQIAIIFELRNYPSYYQVTKRILTDLKYDSWKNSPPRLITEINLTLAYINKFWWRLTNDK